ncbi:hypothetical protein GCM10023189_45970 [Nibrella saemangeumensis]|uniref:Novel STAND NTPase 1 domain-containing protein n=1 Tax=Nibrella saemangeumensis TaxID=1084526 RepID=A0ABP8NFC0_9BACT
MSEVLLNVNPFPGLRSFEPEDAGLYFGRDSQIKEVRKKLAASRFVAVVGSSGSGKSSLVKAGVIPGIEQGGLDKAEFDDWFVITFNPGIHATDSFAEAVKQAVERHTPEGELPLPADEPDWISPRFLSNLTYRFNSNLLIFIDQFEELFRYVDSSAQEDSPTDRFIEILLELLSTSQPVYIVLTVRSDYLDACTNYEGLTEAINQGCYLLPRMTRDEYRQVITRPLEVFNIPITGELTEQILADVGDKHDQLPILQHALMRTWAYWQQNHQQNDLPVSVNDYTAIGTLHGAITLHAEEVYNSFITEKSRIATEKLFKSFVCLGPAETGSTRPIALQEIQKVTGLHEELLLDVIDRFRDPGISFLLPQPSVPLVGETVIDFAHERIVDLWERLQTWVREETESAKLYQQISMSASQYQEGKTGLLTNPELLIALKWLRDSKPTAAWARRYNFHFEQAINYLDYSRKQYEFEVQSKEKRQHQEIKRNRLLAMLGIGLAIAAILATIYLIFLNAEAKQAEEFARSSANEAKKQQGIAEGAFKKATSQSKIAFQLQEIAEQQSERARRQTLLAEMNAEEARTQEQLAKESREEAFANAQEAKRNADQAKRNAETAQKNADIADENAGRARTSETLAKQNAKEANRLRKLAIAQALAIQTSQMPDISQNELPKLLALTAYQLNKENNGSANAPGIFLALSKAANENTILEGHKDNVRSVALNADESLMASASDDGTVRIWDFNSIKPVRTLVPARKVSMGFRSLTFSKDGKLVLAGTAEGQLFAWDVSKPKSIATYPAHRSRILATTLYKAAGQLVTVGAEGDIRTWQIKPTGLDSLVHLRTGLPLTSVALTADGTHLICGSATGKLAIVNLLTPDKQPDIITKPNLNSQITAITLSPNSDMLVTGSADGAVRLWEYGKYKVGEYLGSLAGNHKSTVSSLAFSPDEKYLVSGSYDGSVHVWNHSNLVQRELQQQPISIDDYGNWILDVSFRRGGKRLIISGQDRAIWLMPIDINDLYERVSKKVTRSLTVEEWNKYVGKDIDRPQVN